MYFKALTNSSHRNGLFLYVRIEKLHAAAFFACFPSHPWDRAGRGGTPSVMHSWCLPLSHHIQDQRAGRESDHRQCVKEFLRNTSNSIFTPLFPLISLEKGCRRAVLNLEIETVF